MAPLYLPAPTRPDNKLVGQHTGVSSGVNLAVLVSKHGVCDAGATSSIEASKTVTIASTATTAATLGKRRVPSYAERCDSALRFSRMTPKQRKHPKGVEMFVPRATADFEDGGSFPEIHVAQYPRHMGNPHLEKRLGGDSSAASGGGNEREAIIHPRGRAIVTRDVLSGTVNSTGKVSYDAIVTGGTNAAKKVYSNHSDLRGCQPSQEEIALPSKGDETSTAERTQRALSTLLSTKVAMDKPTGSAITAATDSATAHERTQFIRYTPNENAPGYNPQASRRIIRMVPKQVDPMQPPKHMHRKAPRGPAEDPVPVLHAPPEKLSKEEREAWNVPACISNWKNTRGYTIPLDKRLAADGRGLRDDMTINPNFAVLSESLYVAERQAREEVRTRAAVQKRLVLDQRERREEELRELANKARMERGRGGDANTPTAFGGVGQGRQVAESQGTFLIHGNGGKEKDSAERIMQYAHREREQADSGEEKRLRSQRDRLRAERRREHEREYRLERAGKSAEDDEVHEDLKKKRRLENDRDVSEKIALGTHVGIGGADGVGGVDSRLYSQNMGLSSGFGADDEYNTYSRPMFDREGVTSSSIYRPTRDAGMEDVDAHLDRLKHSATSKFVPDKGFAGAGGNGGGAMEGGAVRTAPVQFEKGN